MGIYNAEISAGSLMVAESRKIAKLMLLDLDEAGWERAIVADNVLQKSPATARRQTRLLRNRLGKLDADGWSMVASDGVEACSQVLLAAAIRHSRLLGDFLRDVYWEDVRRLERQLSRQQWDAFLSECGHRDDSVEGWSESTREKLYQVVARILAEAKYVDSTRKLGLTPPMLHPKARAYIKQLGDDTLARMENSR